MRPFHLAFPVHDLAAARAFYADVLGCDEGRSAADWIDFNLFGHQIVAHLAADMSASPITNAVDGQHVPVPHFGIVLDIAGFDALAARCRRRDRLRHRANHAVCGGGWRAKDDVLL